MQKNILYKDPTVQIGDCYLTIFKYYFPLATSKTIMFKDIEKISIEDSLQASHTWGICTKHLNNWFPLDKQRKNKPKFIAIYVKGKTIRPSFTPDEPQKVFELIWENFTEEGRRVVEFRSSQCDKQTELAQQEIMERMKQEQEQKNKEENQENQENQADCTTQQLNFKAPNPKQVEYGQKRNIIKVGHAKQEDEQDSQNVEDRQAQQVNNKKQIESPEKKKIMVKVAKQDVQE